MNLKLLFGITYMKFCRESDFIFKWSSVGPSEFFPSSAETKWKIVLVKIKYCIKENILARIVTLETDLEGLDISAGVSQRIKDHDVASVDANYKKNPVKTVYMLIKIRTK